MLAQSHFALGNAGKGRRDLRRLAPRGILCVSLKQQRTGFGSPENVGGRPPMCGFLRPCAFARLFQWVGDGGEASACRCRRSGLPTLLSARPPIWKWGAGFRNANVGGRILRQSMHAHTGQQSHLIQSIVRTALRDAATASTYQDALDATGAALAAIAALVRAEVRHG